MPDLSASGTLAAQTFAAGSVPKPTNATDAARDTRRVQSEVSLDGRRGAGTSLRPAR